MPVPFQCPHCGKVTQVADQYVGQSGPCAACGQTVTISSTQQPAAVKAPATSSAASGMILAMMMVVGIVVCGGLGVAALLIPSLGPATKASQRTYCSNNLKQIALALHNYHDAYNTFPPAYTVDEDGNKLHSWRTLILPFIEQEALYRQVDLSTAWDSPQNRHLSQLMIPVYTCPSGNGSNPARTDYMVVVGPETVFDGATPVSIRGILDGTSNTILVVEVSGSTTNWMEPNDLDLETMNTMINGGAGGIGSNHPGGANVAFADGSVRFLDQTIGAERIKSLFTRRDGDTTPAY